MTVRSSAKSAPRKRGASTTPKPEPKPEAAKPEAEAKPEPKPEGNPEAEAEAQGKEAFLSSMEAALVEADKDAKSGVAEPKRVLSLAWKVAQGLEGLSRVLEDARKQRLALGDLIMQVRQCFTFNGKPDEMGLGNAYRDGFSDLIVAQVAAVTKIPQAQIKRDLNSVRSNVLNGEGRKDTAIVARLNAAGDIEKEDWAAWEAALAKVDGKPSKLGRDDVPGDVAKKLAQVYRAFDQDVPERYLSERAAKAQKDAKEAAKAAKSTGGGPAKSDPPNPGKLIGELTSELIEAGLKHPYLLAEALHRAETALSDALIGAPGQPGMTDIPHRVPRVVPALEATASLTFATAGIISGAGVPKEAAEAFRYTASPEAEPVDIQAALKAQVAAMQTAEPEAAEAAEPEAEEAA